MTTASRRTPRSVRLTLAAELGSDVDGAWWPRGASFAAELPELVSALRPKLGDIADIRINWSAAQGAPDLHIVALGASAVAGARRPRLMSLTGAQGHANLLVIPSNTSLALAVLVLRIAAGLVAFSPDQTKEPARSAQRVFLAAKAESANWCRESA